MALDFPGHEDALRRTLEVAERCNVEIELGRILLPKFPTPDGRDAFDYLVELCEKGLQKRYGRSTPELHERLQFELKTIQEMGFADYFLIVWDFIHFAQAERDQRRPGPRLGRRARSSPTASRSPTSTRSATTCSSSASSTRAASRCPTWTSTSPSPAASASSTTSPRSTAATASRRSSPSRRWRPAPPSATPAACSRSRTASSTRIAKLIPEGPGQTLDDCLKPGAELRRPTTPTRSRRRSSTSRSRSRASSAQDSIHAAGVVIGAEPLIDVVPLQQKGADQEVVTQFAMGDVEALGLLKIDFLGLRNLDVIDKAVELVGGGSTSTTIPLDDRKTYEMLARGEATGVFQFESSGMREALRQVKPTEFEDLIALVALYRPGPMEYIPVYAHRKHGQEPVTYIDPRLKPITGVTYGICIYQEQYMEIAKQIAGFSPAEADDLRKAIGKKIHALMASLKEKFLEGCAAERRRRRRSRTSSGRTWRSRRTTPSTSRTPPATR